MKWVVVGLGKRVAFIFASILKKQMTLQISESCLLSLSFMHIDVWRMNIAPGLKRTQREPYEETQVQACKTVHAPFRSVQDLPVGKPSSS